jgi:hypothetical protein
MGTEWKQPTSATGASALARGPAAASLATPGNPSPAAQGTSPNPQDQNAQVPTMVDQTRNLVREGMEHQAKMYGVAFEFGLVEASMESVNKALKSLLTQGGG